MGLYYFTACTCEIWHWLNNIHMVGHDHDGQVVHADEDGMTALMYACVPSYECPCYGM